jgi:hypothetical protein
MEINHRQYEELVACVAELERQIEEVKDSTFDSAASLCADLARRIEALESLHEDVPNDHE